VQLLSKEELEKFDLDPEKIELLKKRLEELAKGKDWKLEVIEVNGGREIRGILDPDDDEDEYGSAEGTEKSTDSTKQSDEDKKGDTKKEQETAKDEDQTKPLKEKKTRPPHQPPPPESTNDDSKEGSEETFKEEL